jgi:hypothetical protein
MVHTQQQQPLIDRVSDGPPPVRTGMAPAAGQHLSSPPLTNRLAELMGIGSPKEPAFPSSFMSPRIPSPAPSPPPPPLLPPSLSLKVGAGAERVAAGKAG